MRVLAVVMVMAFVLGSPAAAGTGSDPELKDPCGVGPHVAQEQVAPWLDLCGVWFSTPSPGLLKVTVEVAALAADRADSQYWVSWSSGGCHFTVQRMDGGAALTPGEAVSRFAAQCDPGHEVECTTPWKELGYHCWETDEDPVVIDVSSSFSLKDNRLSWTLDFAGGLAPYAAQHSAGAVLRAPSAMTTVGVNSAPISGPGYCTGDADGDWQCTNQATDWVPSGRDYVVGT